MPFPWECYLSCSPKPEGFPGHQEIESAGNARDLGLIPGLGKSPGEGNGNPLQYSCLENPMDRQAWQAIQSMESQRVWHDSVTTLALYFPWIMVGAEEVMGPCGRIEGQRFQISNLYLSYSYHAFWKNLFIIIIVVDCAACGLSLVAASRDHSLVMVHRLLRMVAPLVMVHGFSCSRLCGIFPDQGQNPCPLHGLAGRFLATWPPKKSRVTLLLFLWLLASHIRSSV